MTNIRYLKTVKRVMTRGDDPRFHQDKIHHEAPYRIAGHAEIKCTIVFDRMAGEKTYGGYIEIHGKQVLDCGGYTTAQAVRDKFNRYIQGYLLTEDFVTDCLAKYGFQHCQSRIGGYHG